MSIGRRPQFLFYTRTALSKEKINAVFSGLAITHHNTNRRYDRIVNEVEMETDGDTLYWIGLNDQGMPQPRKPLPLMVINTSGLICRRHGRKQGIIVSH